MPHPSSLRNRRTTPDMGNAQSAGKKRASAGKNGGGRGGRRPANGRQTRSNQNATDEANNSSDDEVLEVTTSPTPKSDPQPSTSKATANLRMKIGGPPPSWNMKIQTPDQISKKNSSSHKTAKRFKPETPDIGQEVPATIGPRAKKDDNGPWYQVEAIVDKWVGASDQREKDVFYLIHFKGMKYPNKKTYPKDALEKCWVHLSQMIECKSLVSRFEEEYQKLKEERRRSRGCTWHYEQIDSDEEKEKKGKQVLVEGVEKAGKTLRKRHDNNGDRKEQESKDKHSPQKKEPVGFNRGLEPEKIITAALIEKNLVYLVKWKGVNKADFVYSHICKEQIPQLVLSYLLDRATKIPEISSSQLKGIH